MTFLFRMLAIAALAVPGFLPQTALAHSKLETVIPVQSCADLAKVDLSAIGGVGSAVTGTSETTSDGIAVCQVTATLAPEISVEILLPTKTWTQRYLQVGCGGLCGNISLRSGASSGCQVLNDGGFVMAATDMGHSGDQSGAWGLDAQKRQDFAYRAQHLTSEASKALIKAFYGQAPKYAYFNGCSDGGREALMEAERFPDDFDGIIAGAPAMLFQVQNTLYHGWMARANTAEDGSIILTSDRLPILHDAVLKACDALDGAKDGLIAQPATCNFDLSTITCAKDASDTSACLTPAEAEVARKFYQGPTDPKTGAHLTAGQPLYGSELEWAGVYVADQSNGSLMSTNAALPAIRYLSFDTARPDMTLAQFAFDEATLDALRARHPFFDATNSDMSAFQQKGGKLIMWHGLADPHISPANTVALQNAMIETMGADAVDSFERLYLLPGVAHCGNGQGPSNLDLLTAMMAWVENGEAPDAIMTTTASETSSFGAPDFAADQPPAMGSRGMPPEGKGPRGMPQPPATQMSRPVYPYPHTAKYDGTGDVTKAASWSEGPEAQIVRTHDWPGADLFEAYSFIDTTTTQTGDN